MLQKQVPSRTTTIFRFFTTSALESQLEFRLPFPCNRVRHGNIWETTHMRSQITRRVFLRGSAAILTGLSTFKYSSAQQKIIGSTDYRSTIDKIMQTFPLAMAQRDITGASIALIDGKDTVWSGGFGFTDRFRRTRVTADTLFHVGSISKSFTALGVLKVVDKNLLTLDDPVKRHLPWFRRQ